MTTSDQPREAAVRSGDSLSATRVLVTGGTGFIGRGLIRGLLDAGARVHLLWWAVQDRRELPSDWAGVEWHEGDLRTASTVARAVRKADPELIFHLASAGVTDPFLPEDTALRVNLNGTLNLLRANGGRARVVMARTPGERAAMNVYAASKAAAWSFARMYVRTRGWPILGAMPFQCYGAGQPAKTLIAGAVDAALRHEDFPMTSGAQVRDWVHVDDVARGFVAAARSGRFAGETVGLGTGSGHSLIEVVERVYRLTGSRGKPLPGRLPERPGEVESQIADARVTEAAIGWRAEISLDEGLRRVIEERGRLP